MSAQEDAVEAVARALIAESENKALTHAVFWQSLARAAISAYKAMGRDEWRTIESAPRDEGLSFLIRTHAFGGRETVIIQVSRFEGRLYPDALGAATDWDSAITHAKYWMPLPSPPTGEK